MSSEYIQVLFLCIAKLYTCILVQYYYYDNRIISTIIKRSPPANTGHSPKAVSMLKHRLRRWPNIETALSECPVFAGPFVTRNRKVHPGGIGTIVYDVI